MSIKFAYFDLGNVILTFDHDVMCQQVAKVSGLNDEEMRALLFDSELQNQYETGTISTEEFFQSFCEKTGATPDKAELLHGLSNIFQLNTPIVPLLAQMRAVGFPMGVLSNTCDAHWNFAMGKFRILGHYFTKQILSYEVHSMKPDKGIYQAAIDAVGLPAGEIFFVDDREENVAAAKELGIKARLFKDVSGLVSELCQLGVEINL